MELAPNIAAAVISEQTLEEGSRQMALSNYSEKLIEQKERELRESIAANYSRMRGVEKELSNLQLQLKLTAGPKRLALEMYRRKIEVQNEKVACIRLRHTAAKKALEAIDVELQQEEAAKQELCDALNTLVQQSAALQLNKLEELKQHLDNLSRGVTGEGSSSQTSQQTHSQHPPTMPNMGHTSTAQAGSSEPGATVGLNAVASENPFRDQGGKQGPDAQMQGTGLSQIDAEAVAAAAASAATAAAAAATAAQAAAVAARARHVSLRPKVQVSAQSASNGASSGTQQTPPRSKALQQKGANFDGFDT